MLQAFFVAGLFVLLALPVTVYEVIITLLQLKDLLVCCRLFADDFPADFRPIQTPFVPTTLSRLALVSMHLTAAQVAMHLEYLSRPKLQIRVIRILWMVPIYAVDRCCTMLPAVARQVFHQ